MAQVIKKPRGTEDLLPQNSYLWNNVEGYIKDTAKLFGFNEIRTPIFENTELFLRGVGDTTDVVSKEMYTFLDKGDRSMTLKPEGTAGVVRAAIENGLLNEALPFKAYYITPCFRYDKPQAGRYRQFYQFGVEIIGAGSAACDAEAIALANSIFKKLNIKNVPLFINSIGCAECRPSYYDTLKEYLNKHKDSLCETCITRLEKNPMRVLDCKCKSCIEISNDVPKVIDYICEECKTHFDSVKKSLQALKIPYEIDPKIVRGLDYYTKTVFEFVNLDNNLTLCGGGRYDGLVSELGGPNATGFGFAMGLERVILCIQSQKIEILKDKPCQIYIGSIGQDASLKAQEIVYNLRKNGVFAECDLVNRSVKAQMKYANKINSQFSTILGETEIGKGIASIKNMTTGQIGESSFDDINDYLVKQMLDSEIDNIINNNEIGGMLK